MSAVEIDPQVAASVEDAEYKSCDPYYSQRKADLYELIQHLEGLPLIEHIPTNAVVSICGLSAFSQHRFTWVEHRRTETTAEKAKLLLEISKRAEIEAQLGIAQPEIHPLKTVTLQVSHQGKPYYFLVSRLGDFDVDEGDKEAMKPAVQTILEEKGVVIKGNVMSKTSINPPEEEFPPVIHLGLKPGIIGPFVHLTRFGGDHQLSGLLYLRNPSTKGYAAVAMSDTDTLIINCSILTSAIHLWQGSLNIPFKAVGGEENL